jgi:serine/threonine-protein kinase HipA
VSKSGDNSLDYDLALSVSKYFGLSDARAKTILDEIKSVVSHWRNFASESDISRSEQEIVANAFN